MFKRIFWINLGLFVIVSLLSFNAYQIWLPIVNGTWKGSLPVSKRNISAKEVIPQDEDDSKPALYTYDVIADKDLFRPERTEWLPPPPPTDATDQPRMEIPQYPAERNQPGMKKPTLYGIVIIRDKKSAIMKGSIREEPQKRSRKVRLGNGEVRDVPLPPIPGRVTDDKTRVYRIGDEVSESQIVDILPDRVVLSKNGEEYELLLREPSAPANAQIPGQEPEPPQNVQGGPRVRNPQSEPQAPPRFTPPPGYPVPNPPPGYPAYQPPPGFPAFQPPQGQPGQPGFYPPLTPPGSPGVPPGAPYRFPIQRPIYAPPPGAFQAPPRGRQGAPFLNPFRQGGGPS
ncbi:MAG: hypothetical protein AB1847_15685 [bacterium]